MTNEFVPQFELIKVEYSKKENMYFEITVIDEASIQYFERIFSKAKVTTDGRAFTFKVLIAAHNKETFWKALEQQFPDIVVKYMLARLSGEE
jgi:hypothetical protein